MHQEVKALEDSDPRDQLATLLLRVVNELSPTTKAALIDYVERGNSTPEEAELPGGFAEDYISKALLRLQTLGMVQVDRDQIASTDAGRRFPDELPVVASRPRTPYALLSTARRSTSIALGSALLVIVLSAVGGAHVLSPKHDERPQSIRLFERSDGSRQLADTASSIEPAPYSPIETVQMTAALSDDQQPIKTTGIDVGDAELHANGKTDVQAIRPQPPTDPIIAAIRLKLTEPSLRNSAQSEDLAALQAFYADRPGPPVWMKGMGFTARAQAVINEIRDADAWGLSADAFDVPSGGKLPVSEEVQAADEIKVDLAILKYARFARGGRLVPSRISDLLDQAPNLLDPKSVITEISSSPSPDAYLRSLHPRQEQFQRLRQALLKARATSAMRGAKSGNERDIQRLIINMERWRWMPRELGAYYVWNNIPEFVARVVKNGKTIYVEKTIVGQLNYPTPIFSSEMRSIVFHPEWVVPETIIRDDLQPSLRQNGPLGGPNTAILDEHNLKVSYKGQPVDASSIDWVKANIWKYTFTQAPGPDNVLGVLKFNFPNKHAIYMHDTTQPDLFAQRVRTLSHGCIRVRRPDRLAALLLAEDKGWSPRQVKSLLAKDTSTLVPLNRPLPVDLAYFTAVIDENGKLQTFTDVYGLDSKIGAALFGKGTKLKATTVEADAQVGPPPSSWRAAKGTGGFADSISGLFGN